MKTLTKTVKSLLWTINDTLERIIKIIVNLIIIVTAPIWFGFILGPMVLSMCLKDFHYVHLIGDRFLWENDYLE